MYKTGEMRHNQRTLKWVKASDVGVSTTAVIVVLRIYLFCDLTTAFSAFGCDWKPIVHILIAKQTPPLRGQIIGKARCCRNFEIKVKSVLRMCCCIPVVSNDVFNTQFDVLILPLQLISSSLIRDSQVSQILIHSKSQIF
jgi:hypothetical protein